MVAFSSEQQWITSQAFTQPCKENGPALFAWRLSRGDCREKVPPTCDKLRRLFTHFVVWRDKTRHFYRAKAIHLFSIGTVMHRYLSNVIWPWWPQDSLDSIWLMPYLALHYSVCYSDILALCCSKLFCFHLNLTTLAILMVVAYHALCKLVFN